MYALLSDFFNRNYKLFNLVYFNLKKLVLFPERES